MVLCLFKDYSFVLQLKDAVMQLDHSESYRKIENLRKEIPNNKSGI